MIPFEKDVSDSLEGAGFGADRALVASDQARAGLGPSGFDHGERLETPALITIRPFKLRGTPPCPKCGNNGRYLCECEDE